MRRSNKWLHAEDRCSLPSPRLYPTRVAGLVFNFSRTIVEEGLPDPAKDTPPPAPRRRPTSASAHDSLLEHASAG